MTLKNKVKSCTSSFIYRYSLDSFLVFSTSLTLQISGFHLHGGSRSLRHFVVYGPPYELVYSNTLGTTGPKQGNKKVPPRCRAQNSAILEHKSALGKMMSLKKRRCIEHWGLPPDRSFLCLRFFNVDWINANPSSIIGQATYRRDFEEKRVK